MVNVQLDSGVTYSAPTGTASAAQGRVDAAISRIDGVQSSISSIQSAIAAIQDAIAILQRELAGLEAPDPSEFYRTEQRREGTPPNEHTVTVEVFDSAAFNAAMSRYLGEVHRIEAEIRGKQNELASKERELADKQRELADAQRDLAQAQRDLERALQNDQRALQEAQERYRQQMERVRQMQEEALRAQAEAQKAQDELQRSLDELQQIQQGSAEIGTYEPGDEPPFHVAQEVRREQLTSFYDSAAEARRVASNAALEAANALPSRVNGELVPPVTEISARDFLTLAPRVAAFEQGLYTVETGLLAGADPGASGSLTVDRLEQMVGAWRAAGFSEADIAAAVSQMDPTAVAMLNGINGIPQIFGSDGPQIPDGTEPSNAPDASPEEAAAFVLEIDDRTQIDPNSAGVTAHQFANQIAMHQDDAAWLASFYAALGADKSAEYISQSVTPSNYPNWGTEDIEGSVGAVQTSLEVLYENGSFNQADMDALMGHWVNDQDSQAFRGYAFGGYHFNSGVSQLFAGMSSDAESLQVMFADSAAAVALDSETNADVAPDVAAAAALVIAATQNDTQLEFLEGLYQDDQLATFTDLAFAGEPTVPTLTNAARDAAELEQRNNGIATLMLTLAYADTRDGWQGPGPLTPAQIEAMRVIMIDEALDVFANERSERAWGDDTILLDAMSMNMMRSFLPVMDSLLSDNWSVVNDNDNLVGLRSFFEHALFTPPFGSQSDELIEFLSTNVGDMAQALREVDPHDPDELAGMSDDEFRETFDLSRSDAVHFVGLILGLVSRGLEDAKDAGSNNAEVVGKGVSFVAGILAAYATGPLAAGGYTLAAKIVGGLSSVAISQLAEMSTKEAREYLIANAGFDPFETLEYGQLPRELSGIVDEGGEFDAGWNNGYGTEGH